MKKFFRQILKKILGKLSKKAISRHNTEVILVTGWTGTSIVRELIYHLISDNFNVRRNVSEVWWDFSVPLTILGYEDKKRSLFEWMLLILRTFFRLKLRPKYAHKVVINLDTSLEETAKFWSENINPHIVVVLKERPKSKVLKKFCQIQGVEKILFVYNPDLFGGFRGKQVREFIYGKKDSNLVYERSGDLLQLTYKNKSIQVKIPKTCKFLCEFIPAAFAVGILEGLGLECLASNLPHFDLHPKQIEKVASKLRKFVNFNAR